MRVRLAHLGASAALALAASGTALAADDVIHVPLQKAIDAATASGKLDGSVKFYLAGTGPKGKVLKASALTNKKSNAFAKDHEQACIWTAQSALIQLQDAARNAGANAVTNIVSYFRKNEYKSTTDFECHVGALMAGVALRGDLARIGK
ncbi:excinuclease [Pseudothauera rhizosphaerae]|uniref:Excinuclease n=1 Tax=Pseudothauera rhizosphaerae TaxID=2565932 RepID=A0A4S4ASN9_9RHOO|nr:excinuclease [Pseudothauera rhizosphaerae]